MEKRTEGKRIELDPGVLGRVTFMTIAGFSPEQMLRSLEGMRDDPVTLTPEELERYREWVRQDLIEAAEVDSQEELGLALERLRNLYKRTLGEGDYKTCLGTLKEINRLLKLGPQSEPRSPRGRIDPFSLDVRLPSN